MSEEDKGRLEVELEKLRDDLVQPSDNWLQAWADGPFGIFRHDDVPIDDYIDCLRAVEAGPVGGQGMGVLIQRLRRLYFSFYTYKEKGHTAAFFDLMMNPVTDYEKPPLTTQQVDQFKLNTLYETGSIKTPNGSKVSISHVWALADIAVNGLNLGALTAHGLVFGTPLGALATWLGDLASAVVKYEGALPHLAPAERTPNGRKQLLAAKVAAKSTKGDLLGDLDGVAIGNHWARHPGSFTVSSFLEEYYHNDSLSPSAASQLGRPSAAHRFHYFLKHADPALPAGQLDNTPFVATFDKVTARNRMPALLGNATDDFFDVARIRAVLHNGLHEYLFNQRPPAQHMRKTTEERLDHFDGRDAFHWLCDGFCTFVDNGVRTGNAAWPPT